MFRLFVTLKHLSFLSNINLPLKELMNILTAFYNLPVSLILFTHLLLDACKYTQFALNYTLN